MRIGAFLERRRIALSWIVGVVFLASARPVPATLAAGLIPVIAGAALRTWASGHIRKQRRLARSGPYAFTRNPLYLGSFLMAAGALIMARSSVASLVFVLLAVPLYLTIMRREEKTLEEKFGEDFLKYRREVPLFFPRIGRVSADVVPFDWELVRKHREWRVWAGITGVTLLLLGRYYLG